MQRDPEAILFEAEYWKQVYTDLGSLLQDAKTISDGIAATSVPVVELTSLFISAKPTPEALDAWSAQADPLHDSLIASMDSVGRILERVESLVELVGGRINALTAELHPQQEGDTE